MIVLTTPTGNVGSRVLRLLVQAGARPKVLVRDPARLDEAIRSQVEVAVGDQHDERFVLEATRGADALFWVAPPVADGDPVEAYARLGAIAARAVTENGIGRTVFQSSVGAEKRSGAGEIDGLGRTEQLLDATGANVLHLRCGYFFSNLLMSLTEIRAGTLSTTWPLDFSMPWVDPRDIAEVAAARLLHQGWSGRLVQAVHGPEHLSFADAAGILGDVLGHPVRAQRIPDEQLRAALRAVGMAQPKIDAIAGMAEGLRENFTPADPRTVHTTTPTTLAAWTAQRLLPELRAAP